MSSRTFHLKEISEILRFWNGDRQMLIGAAQEYWAASLDADGWTEPFVAWHERICCLILDGGGIRATIEAMDDRTARLTATELARFSEDARRELPREFIPRFAASACVPAALPPDWRPLVSRDARSAAT